MEKPKIKNVPQLNFMECLEYLEINGHSGITARVWNYFADCFDCNNTAFYMPLPPKITMEEDLRKYKDTLLIKETFDIKEDEIQMYVSW